MVLYVSIIIMFLIGFEMDFFYMKRNLRVVSIIVGGSSFVCMIFVMVVIFFMYEEIGVYGFVVMMVLMVVVILVNMVFFIVVRLVVEFKFVSLDIGRLVVFFLLIGDVYVVFLLIVILSNKYKYDFFLWIMLGIVYFFIVVVVMVFNMYVINWLNRSNSNLKYFKNIEIFGFLVIVIVVVMVFEIMGFSSMMVCLIIGLMFFSGGKVVRTFLIKFLYLVNNFMFLIYFGYFGFSVDVIFMNSFRNFVMVVMVILLSIGGKIIGMFVVCVYLKILLNEGVFFVFLMNLKGYVDLLILIIGLENKVSVFFLCWMFFMGKCM